MTINLEKNEEGSLLVQASNLPCTLVPHGVSSFPKKDFDSSLVCRLNQSFVMLPQFLCPMHHVSRVAQQFLTESDFKILL